MKEIKVITFNFFRSYNKKKDLVLKTIIKEDIDIICFQEFPKKELVFFKKKLSKYFPNVFFSKEEFKNKRKSIEIYTIIFSKYKFIDKKILKHEVDIQKEKPFIYKYLKKYKKISIDSCLVDINFNGTIIRLINTHLECNLSPLKRLKNLEEMLIKYKNQNTILLGDLNTMANSIFSNLTLSIFQSFTFKELFVKEINLLKNLFEKYKMKSIFQNEGTFSLRNSIIIRMKLDFLFDKKPRKQYDFICIGSNLKVKEKYINTENLGSDHSLLYSKIIVR